MSTKLVLLPADRGHPFHETVRQFATVIAESGRPRVRTASWDWTAKRLEDRGNEPTLRFRFDTVQPT